MNPNKLGQGEWQALAEMNHMPERKKNPRQRSFVAEQPYGSVDEGEFAIPDLY